ncbi:MULTISPECIES: hypothetical protein [unclassified Vibrio]|uniref:Phosphate ABC transporter substrate-binding protein n=1 Tax=Vibrio sp. HB236076 TaxID=3232307 RepID=A0AB39HDG1_9VIBR|nr:hypothetical protein [Vibrio sp. HB161653]MDP5253848.1 hypothetical protein [Vibrio sp. HB161653]
MKTILLLPLLFCLFLSLPSKAAEVVVIVNLNNPISSLEKREIIDLFMGKQKAFRHGQSARPFDQSESSIKASFYHHLINKNLAQVNAYWARLLFTGRASPPQELSDDQSIIEAVRKAPGAIAYIDSQWLDDSVKEVFRVQKD